MHSITVDGIEEPVMHPLHTDEQLRSLCADLLDEIGLVPPFDAWLFCARLGEVRERRIRVQGADLGGVTVVGHVLALPDHDRILHDSRAPRAQQELVIYHEAMHLVLGHLEDDAEPLTCGALLRDDDGHPDAEDLRYSDAHEWEAETGATELLQLANRRPRPDEYAQRSRWHGERGVAGTFGLVTRRRGAR